MRLTILALAVTLAACSGSGARMSVSTKVSHANGAAIVPGAVTSSALAIGTHVTLDRARILIRKVVLEGDGSEAAEGTGTGTGTETMSGEGTDAADEVEVKLGPILIDLSGTQLDGGLKILFDEKVPAGKYDELEFQIHSLTPGETVSDPDFVALGHSIILGLTVDGTPFTFTSDLTAVAEIEGSFNVSDGGSLNITVTIDPTGWFTAADGTFLDPRVAANRSQIELNIRNSIHGFEDDDLDGKPD